MFCVNGCETGANPLTKRKTTLNSPTQVSAGYTNISPIIQINLPPWPEPPPPRPPQPPAAWAEWSCSTNIWEPDWIKRDQRERAQGPISRIPCESSLISSLLSRPDNPKLEVPREVRMYLISQRFDDVYLSIWARHVPSFYSWKNGPGGLKESAESKHSECVNGWQRTSARQTAEFCNTAVYQ